MMADILSTTTEALMGEHTVESGLPAHEFSKDELKTLSFLAERVAADAEWYGGRLIVEVWGTNDMGPVAWIECHASDSDPVVRFSDTRDTSPAETEART